MKVLVIDNYDSFTFNLVQLIGRFERDIIVKRNDKITLEEIDTLKPDKILISPGPGRPEDSNMSLEVIKHYMGKIPILGVCLGHQAIGYIFGAKIIKAPELMHGKTSKVNHDYKTIYVGVMQNFDAGRYHSLIIDRNTIPDILEVTSETEDGIVMGIRHKEYKLEGIQYHPESVLTPEGEFIIKNWLKL
ncbi:MAG: aminodeoxychorismate/anthranilate synthase component II [Bacteroidetes bacterium]|nr:aminodeoxychorismate/anthranilate synthase component II [Bacteroidota bacterium]